MRSGIPDQGPPVSERNWGQDTLNPDLKSDTWNPDKKVFGTPVGIVDAMRFAGAVPEVANSRCDLQLYEFRVHRKQPMSCHT